jgi:hypothetical protein
MHLVRPVVARLVCSHCGLMAEPGTLGWRALTAVSHSGQTLAAELAGHEVALDLCRHCLRDMLKSALGIEATANVDDTFGVTDPGDVRDALRWLSDADALIRASDARLAAWRRTEGLDDPHCTG